MKTVEATDEQRQALAKARAEYAELPAIEGWDGIREAVVQFTEVNDYTTFKASYAMKDTDLIIQFFMTPELEKAPEHEQDIFWLKMFPAVIETTAPAHFQAEYPRIEVKYTEELKSWFLRARGYDHLLDVDRYVRLLLDRMDSRLDEAVAGYRAQVSS